MDASFWHELWESGKTSFHEGQANAILQQQADFFAEGERVFVPLCGKTRDIRYFLDRKIEVVGVELSEIAVRELFEELGATPSITKLPAFTYYAAPGLDIYTGDIFDLDRTTLGQVSAVYDRAALIRVARGIARPLCGASGGRNGWSAAIAADICL